MPVRRTSQTEPRDSARAAALRLLGRRDYTRQELADRLLARGYPPDDITTALRDLIDDGTVDDRRTALAHARTASRVKGRGRLRVLRELEARGVARDLAREAIETIAPDDEALALDRVLERRRLAARLSPIERRRLFGQLLRRGFAADAIAHALDRRKPGSTA